MEEANYTVVTHFIILGLSDWPGAEMPTFVTVLFIYLVTICGNMTILLLVCMDHRLQTPMYFFLGNLSVVDMCLTTCALYKFLIICITGNRVISYLNCIAQVYFLGCFISDELLHLTAMSYDRYVAICNPLRYKIIMNRKICVLLASSCWVLSLLESAPYAILVASVSCFKSKTINHFFCDLEPLKKLSCSTNSVLELLTVVEGVFLLTLVPFLLTIIPYVFIIITILDIRSNTGRRKAFYTCSSHLTVVIILYTILVSQYLSPTSNENLTYKKMLSLFNIAAVPMLNPIIYSLKNRDVQSALRRMLFLTKTY
ncbi:olfactory receptor 5V1-like [Gastrophryne carolinensis]